MKRHRSGPVGDYTALLLDPNRKDPNRTRHARALSHEARVAEELGGKPLPNSGAIPRSIHDPSTAAADVVAADLLIQHKGTEKQSYSVRREDLRALHTQAKARGLHPAFMVLFEGENLTDREWVLIPKAYLQRLLNEVGR